MESSIEHETAARHLWLDVLREAEKDNRYHKTTDFAGAFRQFDNFYFWLCLNKYVPGMKVYRYSPVEPFSAKNCELKAEQSCNKQQSTYKVLRLHAKDAREWLARYPDHGIVTIIVRKDIAPKEYPNEVDYET